MDWRPSDTSFACARDVIAEHPKLPVIPTTHELVNADHGRPAAYFTDHGNRVWDQLVNGNDVFPSWPRAGLLGDAVSMTDITMLAICLRAAGTALVGRKERR